MRLRTISNPHAMSQLSGLSALSEIENGWNFFPTIESAQRAIPQNVANRNLGQNFSLALNKALAAAKFEETVQNDGVISLFHIEMFGKLMGNRVAASAFPGVDAFNLRVNPREGLMELLLDEAIEDVTNRLNFATRALTNSPGDGETAASSSMSTGAKVGIAVAGGVVGLLVLRKYANA